jgi:transcriptional regulator with XRE-family HTH domain
MAKRATNSLRSTLGRNVKEFRLSLNMSQTELAERAKIQQPLISKMEGGRGNPTLDSIERIATALGVNVIHLLLPRR